MPFRPKVKDIIEINKKNYEFTEHPSAPKMVYGQAGRRATVFQIQGESGQLYALKVFTNAWRDSRNAANAQKIRAFATLPGLEVCDRNVITPKSHADLIKAYPDLEYAVLMTWINGETWQEIILNGRLLTVEQSKDLSLTFLDILKRMEQENLAHCDLSGPNVLVNLNPARVALVDVEDLFGPGLAQPERIGGGSSGYAHKTAPKGLWRADADRFAGAILLAEMLGWNDERVRSISYGEQYFDPAEVQQNCERYQVLLNALREQWGNAVADTFSRVWFSEQLEDCPNFQKWDRLINSPENLVGEDWVQEKIEVAERLLGEDRLEESLQVLQEVYQEAPDATAGTYARALLTRGTVRERNNDLDGALSDYQSALQIAPEGGLQDELKLIINETKLKIAPPTKEEETQPIPTKLEKSKMESLFGKILLGFLFFLVSFIIGRLSVSSVPPKTETIYYSSNRSGVFDIYRLDNGQPIRVVHNAWDPVTSPQGFLYFTSNREGKKEIFYLSDTEVVQVTHSSGHSESWSPFFVDNELYFVSNRSGKNEIWRIMDSQPEQVTNTPGKAFSIIHR